MPAELMRDRLIYRVFHSTDEDAADVLMSMWAERFGTGSELAAEDARAQAEDLVAAVSDDSGWFVIAPSGRIEVVSPLDVVSGWEDAEGDVWAEVQAERQRQVEKGYTPEHDEAEGFQHLLEVAAYHQSHFGEAPTDEFIRGELIEAIATLYAAVEFLDRGIMERSRAKKVETDDLFDHGGWEDH